MLTPSKLFTDSVSSFASSSTNLVTMQILFAVPQSHVIVVIDELGRLLVLLLAFRSTEQREEDRQTHNLS